MTQLRPYLYIAPSFIILLVFSIFPILVAFVISFTGMDLFGLMDWSRIKFIGIANYRELLGNIVFRRAILNTLYYVVIGVPMVICLSLTLAILINSGTSAVFKAFRAIYYLPSITNMVAVAVIWMYLYNTRAGLFNQILGIFGIDPVNWLGDQSVARVSLIFLAVWRSSGFNMLIFLAALQGIPREYYEAAKLDGAGALRRIWSITLPLLRHAILFVSITTVAGWLQFFEEPYVMTKGGPVNATMSMSLFIFQTGFTSNQFGFAAAGSFVMFVMIVAITLIQLKVSQRRDDK